jgi:hypothetical protein
MYFAAGQSALTTEQANLLNEIARGYATFGFKLGVTSWPLTVHRVGRLGGQVIGFDPKALEESGDGSGSGGQITVVIDICLDGTGGGYVRRGTIDFDTGGLVAEWCEAIPTCGSGSNGGLCDDLLPVPGSGSGSGGTPQGGTATCCSRTLNATLTLSLSGAHGSTTLTWNGTVWAGSKALAGGCGTLYVTFTTGCGLTYSCNNTDFWPASATPGSEVCTAGGFVSKTFSIDLGEANAGCATGCGVITGVVSE